jgi:DMSO/TMAO reductase YedYZ molybdopterin-dependent catalytic subunit
MSYSVGDVMPSKRVISTAILLTILVTAILFVGVMAWWLRANETNEYEYVEVREYEGQDLSSISNFRENSIKGPQYADNETYLLTVTGLVNNEREYTYDEVLDSYPSFKKVVTLNCVEGWKVTILWEGIPLKDLLANAEVKPEATVAIFYAYDGYSTSLPLDYIVDHNIMIAYKMNNVTLPPERGYPFQLVAESKWGYKWIKWITAIELSDNADYKGYWESRGYPNDADL